MLSKPIIKTTFLSLPLDWWKVEKTILFLISSSLKLSSSLDGQNTFKLLFLHSSNNLWIGFLGELSGDCFIENDNIKNHHLCNYIYFLNFLLIQWFYSNHMNYLKKYILLLN